MKKLIFGALCALTAVAALAFQPIPASADINGIRIVSASSAVDSEAVKNASVTCPSGTTVIGTGHLVSGGQGHVLATNVAPRLSGRGVDGVAVETATGTPFFWSLTVFAICSPGSAEVIERSSGTNSRARKQVTIECPAGEELRGAGHSIVNGRGAVHLTTVSNIGTTNTLVVAAEEPEAGFSGRWRLDAYAICEDANGTRDEGAQNSGINDNFSKSMMSRCGTNRQAAFAEALLNAPDGDVHIRARFPVDDGRTWQIHAGEDRPATRAWGLHGGVLCD